MGVGTKFALHYQTFGKNSQIDLNIKSKIVQMRTYALVSLLFGFVVFGCQKDDIDESDDGSSKMQLITSAAWKYDTAVIDLNSNGNFDNSDQQLPSGTPESCERDNMITLKDDGTGTVDEGGSKCNTTDPQTTSLTWQFKNDETVINIPDTLYGAISGDINIIELTDTKLRISKETTIDYSGIKVAVTFLVDLKH